MTNQLFNFCFAYYNYVAVSVWLTACQTVYQYFS